MKNWMLISLLLFTSFAFAWPVDSDGNRLILLSVEKLCGVKGDVVAYVYLNRDTATEDEMLEFIKDGWVNTWAIDPDITYSTYVDMQRVVRDAYRKDVNGEFIRECCSDDVIGSQIEQEVSLCLYQLEY